MNASKLPENKATSAGSELWVVKNDPSLLWWAKLDFGSHFLLSQNLLKPEKSTPEALQNIIQATSFTTHQSKNIDSHVLLGSEDHFLNKWILLWSGGESIIADVITEAMTTLKVGSVRLFSDSKVLLGELEARPLASSLNITYIENT